MASGKTKKKTKKTAKKKSARKSAKKRAGKKATVRKSAKKSSRKRSANVRHKAAEKDPSGGLTAAGRKAFARKDGSHLKPGVTKRRPR